MATSTDEVIVRFKTEGGDTVEETFRRVADGSDRFHQKVTKAGGALGDLRLKSEGRIASNIGAIAQAMTGGANSGELFAVAVTKATESLRGSLLVAGTATATLAIADGLTRAGEAAIKFDSEVSNLRARSLIPGQFLGLDEINKDLNEALTKIDALKDRARSEELGGPTGRLSRLQRNIVDVLTGKVGFNEPLKNADEREANDLRNTTIRLLDSQAAKQEDLNRVTIEGLIGNERQAELDEADIAHQERLISILALKARLNIERPIRAEGEEAIRSFAVNAAIERRALLEQNQLYLQSRVADISESNLTDEEKRLDVLREQEKSLERILQSSAALSQQDRERLEVQLSQSQANVRNEEIRQRRGLLEEQAGIDRMSPDQKWQKYWQDEARFESLRGAAGRLGLDASDLLAPRFGETYDPFGPTAGERASRLFDRNREPQSDASAKLEQSLGPLVSELREMIVAIRGIGSRIGVY